MDILVKCFVGARQGEIGAPLVDIRSFPFNSIFDMLVAYFLSWKTILFEQSGDKLRDILLIRVFFKIAHFVALLNCSSVVVPSVCQTNFTLRYGCPRYSFMAPPVAHTKIGLSCILKLEMSSVSLKK